MLHQKSAQYGIITFSIIDYDNQILGLQRLFAARTTKMADSYYHVPRGKAPITSHSVARKIGRKHMHITIFESWCYQISKISCNEISK
jgi:hypothetical protein